MVMIQDSNIPSANEKPLRISGDPQKCQRAKEMVLDLLAEKEMEVKRVFFHHFAHRNDMLKIKIFVLTIIAIDIFLQNMNKGFNDYGSYGGGGGGPPMEVSFRYCV